MDNKKEIKITVEGYEQLKKELKYLLEKREEIITDLKIAYDFGDLRENSEFDSAKQRQALCDKRIKIIEYTLSHAIIVKHKNKKIVDIGSTVTLEYLEDKSKEIYKIVGPEEISIEENKISYQSPLGKAIMGKKNLDIVTISSPTGDFQVKIIKIV